MFFSIREVYTRKTSNARKSCNDARVSCSYAFKMGSIHKRIKEGRERKGLSMEQLAEIIGVSWQTIQQWENGKTLPDVNRENTS